ncbi:MAG: helix-turn-helix domain-containing protein [Gracilibacteraceae bacterium]|nr:helix-turn-helix domain-containing protein [Gracilibacteraceae bacterium]
MIYAEIMDILLREFPLRLISAVSGLEIKDVRLLDKKTKNYCPDTLYVGLYPQVKREQISGQTPLLLCGQIPPDFLAVHECLATAEEEDLYPLYNAAKDLCLDEWRITADLAKFLAVSKENYLTEMVNEAARIVGNPIIVMDISYNILAYSENVPGNDLWWTEFSKTKHFSHDFISDALRLEQTLQTGDNEPFLVTTCAGSAVPKLSSRMVANHRHIGSIVMRASNTPIENRHFQQLAVISKVTANTIESIYGFKYMGTIQEKLLADILDAKDKEQLYSACQNMENICKKDIPAKMRASVVRCRENGSGNAVDIRRDLVSYLRFGLKSLFSSSCVACHHDHLVMLNAIEADRISLPPQQLRVLADYAENEKVRIGVSNTFTALHHLPNAYRQGTAALAHGGARISYYADCMFEDMLAACSGIGIMANMPHPMLDLLLEHDARNGANLYETLRIYLESGKNVKKCAERLYLHRSTLYYRLNRIKELTETDIDEPGTSFVLLCSYRIRQSRGSRLSLPPGFQSY